MKLGELAFACYIYGMMSDYDSSYRLLVEGTRPQLDLASEMHLQTLLKWLNQWGCRQFAIDYHPLAAQKIQDWYGLLGRQLLQITRPLVSLTDRDLALVERAFANLAGQTASYRKLSGRHDSAVEVGSTGAAKILFALRPDALIPWDMAIRAEYGSDGSGHSYVQYLRIAQGYLEQLRAECKANGFKLEDLPAKIGRPDSSLPKLIDEYHWVTISNKCPVPQADELRRWVSWL